MKHKNIRIIIIISIAFTTLSAGCGIRITKNYYNVEPKTQKEIDNANYTLKAGSQSYKSNDEQG